MARETEKFTYTDGQYFCNACDSPHEGESLAEACFDSHPPRKMPHEYRRVHVVLKDSNGSDVLNAEIPEPDAVWEVLHFMRDQIEVGAPGSLYFEPVEQEEE